MKKGETGVSWQLVLFVIALGAVAATGYIYYKDIPELIDFIIKGTSIEKAEQTIAAMDDINEERFPKGTLIILPMFIESGYKEAIIIKEDVGQGWTLKFNDLSFIDVAPIITITQSQKLETILDHQQLWATVETSKGVFMHIPDPYDTSSKTKDLRWFYDKNKNNSFDEGEDTLGDGTPVTTVLVTHHIKEDLVQEVFSG